MAAFISVTLVDSDGAGTVVSGRAGASLMKAALAAGIDGIAADCGGCLSCATCHVFVDAGWLAVLPPISADESAMLDMTATPRTPSSRLSCQIVLTPVMDGLRVTLPETQY
jgi:2Fe-2S ferredoxin